MEHVVAFEAFKREGLINTAASPFVCNAGKLDQLTVGQVSGEGGEKVGHGGFPIQ